MLRPTSFRAGLARAIAWYQQARPDLSQAAAAAPLAGQSQPAG